MAFCETIVKGDVVGANGSTAHFYGFQYLLISVSRALLRLEAAIDCELQCSAVLRNRPHELPVCAPAEPNLPRLAAPSADELPASALRPGSRLLRNSLN
jgi:hypothetical protein